MMFRRETPFLRLFKRQIGRRGWRSGPRLSNNNSSRDSNLEMVDVKKDIKEVGTVKVSFFHDGAVLVGEVDGSMASLTVVSRPKHWIRRTRSRLWRQSVWKRRLRK